ncbi:S8 family peptidase [Roseofilum sp. Guam]|uniref:S8 family peptidase n=1 Tax=Roseofilum sp. Guam TaxID=2821502 RepID=UPI001B121C68|nr:S8 family peptidase [Roseofilum sp. Guam]MBP0027073.1 S8 family peptidase [Roseofilum sp. Guam]
MSDRPKQYPHLSLRLVREGKAKLSGGGKKSDITLRNKGNAGGHSRKLKSSIDLITTHWQEEQKKREQEGKPKLPDAVSFILEVDPDSFNAEDLKSFGIEVVADLEQGYIIGASADTELSELSKKIDNFIEAEKHVGKVPEIWDILEGTKRPEYILSDSLKAEWENLREQQEYIVDVGISCIKVQEQYSRYPNRKKYKSDETFKKGITKWLDNNHLSEQEFDDLHWDREQKLDSFIRQYRGDILKSIPFSDSFSCRIRISGKGLKDLVFNFPYIFDVSEPDEFSVPSVTSSDSESDPKAFTLEAPDQNAPKVCVIDSGIQERHPLLEAAINSHHSKSWVPRELDTTVDYVQYGGHGTRVAGAILYPRGIPTMDYQQAICWLQNARILDRDNQLPRDLFPPKVLEEIVAYYYDRFSTRIFNHSIAAIRPCRTQSMSAWAATIDKLTWEKQGDILFIVAAGNLNYKTDFITRPSIDYHLQNGQYYPDYLLEKSARIANPAQSLQALTVGSVSHVTYKDSNLQSMAEKDHPSAFSCTGLGIWDTIKPEVVEYGGDYVTDSENSPNFSTPEDICPELVRSTRNGGRPVSSDAVGTSFAVPKVSHIAATLAAEFPQESALLYRALIVQSARLPDWTNESKEKLYQGIRTMGYGIPNLDRALENTPNRITLITQGNERISAGGVRVYQVQIPEMFLRPDEDFDFLVEITLSYVAEPRRTRRHRRKYLSTWLDWRCSNRGEDPDGFLAKILKEYKASEDSEKGTDGFQWTLGRKQFKPDSQGKKRPKGIDGIVKEISRSNGTIQKDWARVKSYDLREGFCIAVVGHQGWNKNEDATVPYCLVVSFEAVQSEVAIYEAFVQVQQSLQVQQKVQVSV